MFDWKLEEGQVYEMSCFSVLPESDLYRTTLHPYKLVFQSKAKVMPSKSCSISQFGLSLTYIAEICSHTYYDYEFLVVNEVRVLRLQKRHEYCLLGYLSSEVGWNYYDTIKENIEVVQVTTISPNAHD
ncbi:unnamed protein product [Trifolium pratense]|uniref:Uncharacterized protein n=1 Tax=Trifolium pratense TaxID=57577 RepID=A0ACB0JXF2_TRIPR|nr:unnamed protein product [Trifolium pratense]